MRCLSHLSAAAAVQNWSHAPLLTLGRHRLAQTYQILNCDDHANYLRKHKRDPKDYRPDILHQARRRPALVAAELSCPPGECARRLRVAAILYLVKRAVADTPQQPGGQKLSFYRLLPWRRLQALLTILDSPLNKAGRVKARSRSLGGPPGACAGRWLPRPTPWRPVWPPQAVYVTTAKGVLFKVNPTTRIPRTFKRFCGLMGTAPSASHSETFAIPLLLRGGETPTRAAPSARRAVQLLQKLSIRASNGPDKLLRVIKQPVTKYLPVGAKRVGLSHSAPSVVRMKGACCVQLSRPPSRARSLGTRRWLTQPPPGSRCCPSQSTWRTSRTGSRWCSWRAPSLTGGCGARRRTAPPRLAATQRFLHCAACESRVRSTAPPARYR